ncbi:hypothetical protein, partial [Klebsiella pneumoniae]|uniref:hypothetical protein n=1 Tax=Klebsiella pneumoniae TaxID=573 RepID=UPI001C12A057
VLLKINSASQVRALAPIFQSIIYSERVFSTARMLPAGTTERNSPARQPHSVVVCARSLSASKN